MNTEAFDIPTLPGDEPTDLSEPLKRHPLAEFVSAAVPLRILAILQEYGEPTDRHWEETRAINDWLGEKGDLLLFKSDKKGETASLANAFAQAIACLAFVPGGIEIFGQRFDAKQYGWASRAD